MIAEVVPAGEFAITTCRRCARGKQFYGNGAASYGKGF
jgi:hypothetical protein